ncbi:MAG: hypothetical protein ABIF82_04610 [Planctomycetota bacterium]
MFVQSPIEASVTEACKREVAENIQHVPLVGLGRTTKDKKEDNAMPQAQDATDHQVELVEYCDLYGGWHHDGECPMELGSSACELAHKERMLEAGSDGLGDEVWF